MSVLDCKILYDGNIDDRMFREPSNIRFLLPENIREIKEKHNCLVDFVFPQYSNMFLKDNTIESEITTIGQRVQVAGNTEVGLISTGFTHSAVDNTLQYIGATTSIFKASCSISLSAQGQNRKLGVYLAINTGGSLDPDVDRISESEVYTFSSANRNEAVSVFFLRELNLNDRVYVIVQNETSTTNILVEFFNLILEKI